MDRMRATPLLLALSLAAAASPVVLSAHPSAPADQTNPAGDKAKGPKGDEPRPGEAKGPRHEKPRPAKAKGPKGTHHLLHACVRTDATLKSSELDLGVLGGNRHMRRVLGGETSFSAKIDDATVVRLVGKARIAPEGSATRRLPKIGTFADLDAGDRVIVRFRAARGLDADAMPAAFRIIDRGPSGRCEVVDTTPPVADPPADPSL
jgi:hypothetical protein